MTTRSGIQIGLCVRLAAVGIAAATIASMQGCLLGVAAAAGAGVATYAYVDGEFKADIEASAHRTSTAAEAVCNDMGFVVKSASASDIDGRVEASTAAPKDLVIKIKRETDKVSKVSIRVGVFGDEALSREIFEKIKARL